MAKNVLLVLFIIVFALPVSAKAENHGVASWYGGGEKLNKYTANGETFNPKALTCASWDFPFNARLKIINIANGKSVIVRVNDRGPAKRLGRAVDLTKHAFGMIERPEKGIVLVKIERIEQK